MKQIEKWILSRDLTKNAKSVDIAMLVYSFGLLEIGSVEFWDAMDQQVYEKFKTFSSKDFDMVVQGFSGSEPFEKGTPDVWHMFEQTILYNFGE